MQKIALIAPYSWTAISSPLINSIICFSKIGYQIDLYAPKSTFFENKGVDSSILDKVNYVELPKNFTPSLKNKLKFRILGGETNFYEFVDFAKTKEYKLIIGYDQIGVCYAHALSQKTNTPYIFHSLEIEKKEKVTKYSRKAVKKALFSISQDTARAEILSKLYNTQIKSFKILYNSSIRHFSSSKSSFFQDKFNVHNKEVILACGTLSEDHLANKFNLIVENLNENQVLIAHGWCPEKKHEEELIKLKHQYPNKFFYSDSLLPFDKKHDIFKSASVSLVLFSTSNDNLKYATGSAGKLYDSIQYNTPVVALNLPGAKKLIEKNNIGFIANSLEDIPLKCEKVIKNINSSKLESAHNVFEFENCFKNVFSNYYL